MGESTGDQVHMGLKRANLFSFISSYEEIFGFCLKTPFDEVEVEVGSEDEPLRPTRHSVLGSLDTVPTPAALICCLLRIGGAKVASPEEDHTSHPGQGG